MTKQTKCSRSGDGWLGELRATKEIEDTAAFNKGPKPQKQKQDKDKKKKKKMPSTKCQAGHGRNRSCDAASLQQKCQEQCDSQDRGQPWADRREV